MGLVGVAAFWIMVLALCVAAAGLLVSPLSRSGKDENPYAVGIGLMERAVRPALWTAGVAAAVFAVAVAVDAIA